MLRRASWLLCGIVVTAEPTSAQPATEPMRSIASVRGDLYRADYGADTTVFLVTPEGIVLADPLTEPAALWLKSELQTRFPDRPVRYVIHSHHHFERAEGAVVFEMAETIGHRRFGAELREARRHLPASYAELDCNGNDRFDADELTAAAAAPLRARDRNKDGIVHPDELYTRVPALDSDYIDRRRITLGGRSVELVHPGPAHARDNTILLFPAERVVFAADSRVARPDLSFARLRARDALRWADTLAALDYDLLVSGHGETRTPAEVTAFRAYIGDLLAGVAAGYERGWSIDRLRATLLLDAHRTRPEFAGRAAHIADIHRALRIARVELFGTGGLTAFTRNTSYCATFDTCEWPAITRGTMVGASASLHRYTIAAEILFSDQVIASRTSFLYDDAFAHRQTSWSLLVGYGPARRGLLSFRVLAGPTMTRGDTRGLARVKEAFAPAAGRRPIVVSESRSGFTVGADLALSVTPRLAVVAPLRLTRAGSYRDSQTWPGTLSFNASVGLRVGAVSHVR